MIMPIDIDKKEFSRDKKGYNSREVDEFLDIVVRDYDEFAQTIKDQKTVEQVAALRGKKVEEIR